MPIKTKEALISTYVEDEEGNERLKIQLTNAFVGIDIVTSDGQELCILNILDFAEGAGNVDVILSDEKWGRFMAWDNGIQHVYEPPGNNVSVYAVDIKPKR